MSETIDRKKIALVSGANRGIGLAIAIGLAQRDITVLMGSRNIENGQKACEGLKEEGLDITPVQLDTTDDASVWAACGIIQREYGRLDILVNNAGIGLDFAQDLSVTERLEATLNLNVIGTLRLTDALIPLLEEAGHATVVNVSSELGSFGLRANQDWIYASYIMPTYQASKAA
nr:SDR family NAD(P)-dependent oxidoreductase [Acetobacter persici]